MSADDRDGKRMLRAVVEAGVTGPALWVATNLVQLGAASLVPIATSYFGVIVAGVGTMHAGLSAWDAAALLQTFAAASTAGVVIPAGVLSGALYQIWRRMGRLDDGDGAGGALGQAKL
jgi:hypothetical protein